MRTPTSNATALSVPEFCTACGHAYDTSDCPVSHDTTSASEDTGIGRMVTYRRGLRRRRAVVVGGTTSAPVVLESTGGGERTVPGVEDVEGTTDWLKVPSALYRLETLAKTPEWNQVLTPWLDRVRANILATIGDRRAFALAAIGAGDRALAVTSGLPDSEIKWLAMHAQHSAGDLERAFRTALLLDPATYPDHGLVLIAAVTSRSELLEDPDLRKHVRRLGPGFPGWAILTAAMDGAGDGESASVSAELVGFGATRAAAAIRSVVDGRGWVDANPWSRASTGASLSAVDLNKVHADYPEIADDMIDARRVETSSVQGLDSPYLRARIGSEWATDEELRSLGATNELSRRAYVSGDRQALADLGEESHSTALHYLSLDALRRGEVPDDLPDDATLKAVVASIRSEAAHPNALADPSTWPILSRLITEEDAERHPDQAAAWQLDRALDELSTWQFESALARARSALKWSDDEAIRDEALNIIGFVLYQQESDESAISALEKALEGEYSANLQANIGIIAEELQPEVAAHHVGRLAIEAPTTDLQLAAVRHAFGIWTTSADAWDEDGLVMPEDLRSVFRKLVVTDIPHDDYVSIVQLLARADDEWLARDSNTRSGPHASSAARLVYRAKASHDPSEYVEALAQTSKAGNDEEWFIDEKDGFVESLRSLIFSEDGAIGPASYAFAAIDAGLELDDFDYVTLSSGAAMSILGAIANDEALPSDSITAMVDTARSRLMRLDEEQREHLSALVSDVGNQYGAVHASFYVAAHNHILEGIQAVAGQLYGVPRRNIRWSVVTDAVQPMRKNAVESAQDVARALAYVEDDDLRKHMTDLIQRLKGLVSQLENPRGMF